MDEPLASLDAQTRESMQEELLTIWQKTGTTTIFVTHQIDEAIYLGDRVIVLSSRPGKIIDTIGISLPRPRELDVKQQTVFREFESHIWRLLRNETDKNSRN
jgi:NitT/TauT family transport system ATP-binding protein